MRDRLPAYGMANRVKITQDDGTIVEGVLSYADGATQQGSAYNKANVLPDIVCMTLGLSTESEPRDLFDVLAHAGDLHVWRKTVKNAADVPAGYNLGVKTTKTILNTTGNSHGSSAIYYSSSVSVSDSGTVSLKNPTSTSVDIYTSSLPIVGKFFYIALSAVQTSDLIQKKIYFVPSDTDISVDDNPKAFSGVVQEVTGYAKVPAATTTTYPVSTNPNAYQEGDDAKAAGYTLGEVETGKFALGVGASGAENQYKIANSITVDDSGSVSLVNPTYMSLNGSGSSSAASNTKSVIGKFLVMTTEGNVGDFPADTVWFIPTDANTGNSYNEGDDIYNCKNYVTKRQPVTGYAAIPAGTTIEYLGKLGDKARVQVVSYVGTGTYGSSNPNSLTFDFVPKAVFVVGTQYSDGDGIFIMPMIYGYGFSNRALNDSNANYCIVTWNEKNVTWYAYSSNAVFQSNSQGGKYFAVAIG